MSLLCYNYLSVKQLFRYLDYWNVQDYIINVQQYTLRGISVFFPCCMLFFFSYRAVALIQASKCYTLKPLLVNCVSSQSAHPQLSIIVHSLFYIFYQHTTCISITIYSILSLILSYVATFHN